MSRVTLLPGDSLWLEVPIRAIRGKWIASSDTWGVSDRWVGPLPGTYRFQLMLHKCWRKGRLACPVSVVSAPFVLRTEP